MSFEYLKDKIYLVIGHDAGYSEGSSDCISLYGVYSDEEEAKELRAMTKYDKIKELTNEILKIYREKNADYGDSFSKSYKEFGMIAPVVRMSDKMERIKQLSKAEDIKVKDESLRDTAIDLANYALMLVIEMDLEKEEEDREVLLGAVPEYE